MAPLKVVVISDTHGLHDALHAAMPIPDGDVFVHAGDFTDTGDRDEVVAFNEFLGKLPHRYKLVIAGNHECTFDQAYYPHNWEKYGHPMQYDPVEVRALLTNALYLEDQAVLIEGFKFYGSPWQPEFCNWAFNLPRGDKLNAKWAAIPNDVDVLITHTPPLGRGDRVGHMSVGDECLLKHVQERIRPPFHVFGHVHEGYGSSSDGVTTFLNASSCTHEYEAVNPAFELVLTKPRAQVTPEERKHLDYAQLLHQRLRLCSQKVPFVDTRQQRARGGANGAAAASCGHSLREFRVDGTTSGLLFESTLKIRPVVGVHARAMRYLFHRGHAQAPMPDLPLRPGHSNGDDRAHTNGVASEATPSQQQPGDVEATAAARRRASLSRRVTMAVLNDVADHTDASVESVDLEQEQRRLFRSPPKPEDTIGNTNDQGSNPNAMANTATAATGMTRRKRTQKTLARRDCVARLAPMKEEEEEPPRAAAVPAAPATVRPKAAVTTTTLAVVPQQPAAASNCMLCKYNVPGHVHSDGAQSSSAALSPPAASVTTTPTTSTAATTQSAAPPSTAVDKEAVDEPAAAPVVVVECTLCKFKVPGHVHPGAPPPPPPMLAIEAAPATPAVDADANDKGDDDHELDRAEERTRMLNAKRMSSWF